MSIPMKILQSDGRIEAAPVSVGSLNEMALKEPEGVYTVARTFDRTKAVLFDAHLDRLEDSARLEQMEVHQDRKALRLALSQILVEGGSDESRFRITIPRDQPDLTWLAAEPLQDVPDKFKRDGVKVATRSITRPNPRAKSNAWVNRRNEAIKAIPPHVYEGIILQDDYLMEGFSSNVYMIKAGVLHTAEQGILHGIARQIVLEIAPEMMPVQLDPIKVDELPWIDEAFLTSSSRGIVPIVQIDDQTIANELPGPLTCRLSAAYDAWVDQHLEPIWPG